MPGVHLWVTHKCKCVGSIDIHFADVFLSLSFSYGEVCSSHLDFWEAVWFVAEE